MKKLILALIMALPCISIAQISTQKISNTGVIYDANSALRVNGSTVLSNETVNGSMTVNGVSTLNSNLTVNGITTINSNLVVTGSQTFNGDETVNGSLLVTNSFQVNGKSTLRDDVVITNGTLSIFDALPILSITETNRSMISGSNTEGGIAIYGANGFSGGTIFGASFSTNGFATGTLPGDMVLRSEPQGRIDFIEGTTLRSYMQFGGSPVFVVGPTMELIASNAFTAATTSKFVLAATFSNTVVMASTLSMSNNPTVGGRAIWIFDTAPILSTQALSSVNTKYISHASNFVYVGSANIGGTGTNWVRITSSGF